MPSVPVNRNSLPATMTLLLPTLAKIMSLSNVNVNLISSPIVNTPLLLAAPLSIRQALFSRGSGTSASINKVVFLPKIFTSRKFCASPLKVSLTWSKTRLLTGVISIILPALLMVWVETTTPSLRKSTIDPLILLTIALRL